MPVLPASPADPRETKIFATLLSKSTPDDGLAERASRLIEVTTPLLDLIVAGPFREFTLHNRDHAKKVLHLMGTMIPEATLHQLSALECTMLVYCAYLHDLGLCLTSTERRRIIASAEFQSGVKDWPELDQRLADVRTSLDKLVQETSSTESGGSADVKEDNIDSLRFQLELDLFQLQEAALCAYLRPRHATSERYDSLLTQIEAAAGRTDLFKLRDVSFKDFLIDICVSHNLDAGVLAETRNAYEDAYPRDLVIAGERLNTQFCAALLRLSDILDFDRERTPPVLFESLGIATRSVPGAEVSLEEWQKHLAVHSIEFQDDEVIVSASCKHPAIESAVRSFCGYIERELRDTTAVLRRNPSHVLGTYFLDVPPTVRPRVRSEGYVFKEMAFRLNQMAVMSLLMGERLYSSPTAAVRELVQNAVDACSARRRLEAPNYSPEVLVRSFTDDLSRVWLEVTDNGIGMDERVLAEYFFEVGSSYYSSPEFRRIMGSAGADDFIPVSRFGIGVVSVFMIADFLEVTTANHRSIRGDTKTRVLRVDPKGGLAFVTEQTEGLHGTSIRIRLRGEFAGTRFLSELGPYLQQVVARPAVPVTIELTRFRVSLQDTGILILREGARAMLRKMQIQHLVLDLERWSDSLAGVVVLFFAELPSGVLSHRVANGDYLRFERHIPLKQVFSAYRGNRVTVNGFRMAVKNSGRILSRRLTIAYDINVHADNRIEYNVSRERVTPEGLAAIRGQLRDAIVAGMKEMGVWDRLARETQELLFVPGFGENRQLSGRHLRSALLHTPEGEAMLQAVKAALPPSPWPKHVHKVIARQLGISNGAAHRAISALLDDDRIEGF